MTLNGNAPGPVTAIARVMIFFVAGAAAAASPGSTRDW